MVNAFGYYASSKGMVLVPNLSNLSRTAAIAAIEAANLVYVDGGSVSTNNISLNDIVAIQLPNAGELVDYETNVEFTYYTYVATTTTTSPPPFFPPFFPFFPTTTTVPNIVGLTISAASSTLTSSNLVLGSSTGQDIANATSSNNNTIISQNPAAGQVVNTGTAINYTNYSYVTTLGLTGTGSQGGFVQLNWNQISGALSYDIRSSVDGVTECVGNIFSVSLDAQTPGLTHSYRVRAFSAAGCGGTQLASETISVSVPGEFETTTTTPAPSPTTTTTTTTTTTAAPTWFCSGRDADGSTYTFTSQTNQSSNCIACLTTGYPAAPDCQGATCCPLLFPTPPFFPPFFPSFTTSAPTTTTTTSTTTTTTTTAAPSGNCAGTPPFPDCFCPSGATSWVC